MKKISILFISALILVFISSMSFAFGTAGKSSAAAPVAGPSLSGKVAETMDSGGYTYMKLEKDGKNTWVAIPNTKVTVGQDVSVAQGMTMSNFTSKSLNKTFDSIIFSAGLAGGQASSIAAPPVEKRRVRTPAKVKRIVYRAPCAISPARKT